MPLDQKVVRPGTRLRTARRIGVGTGVLCLAVLFGTAPSQAQQPTFDVLSTADGLSDDHVTQILQDQQGFLWFGTDDGLNRYDGYQFVTYRHDASDPRSLNHSTVTALYEEQHGQLWVGTWEGLNRFDPRTASFTSYHHDPEDSASLQQNFVRVIYGDRAGRLWVGTYGGGLHRFDPDTETFVNYRHNPDDPNSLSHDFVHTICEDRAGRLWIGTAGGGLNRFDPEAGSFTTYAHNPDEPGDDQIYSLLSDEDGGLWVGRLRGGLDYFDPETRTFTHYGHPAAPAVSHDYDTITDMEVDETGRLWVATWEGLALFDRASGTFTVYQHDANDPTSLSNNVLVTLHRDASGVLWIGTFGGGVNKMAPSSEPFRYYVLPAALTTGPSKPVVSALHQGASGNVWIGTDTGDVILFDPKTGSYIPYHPTPGGPLAQGIIALYEDRHGTLWVSTSDQGVARLDAGTETFRYYRNDPRDPKSLGSQYATLFYEDGQGRFWIGTKTAGLSLYDPARDAFTVFRQKPGEVPRGETGMDFTNALAEDSDGSFWLGTWLSGVIRFDPDTRVTTYYRHDSRQPGSLAGNTVHAVYVDRGGGVWAGLNGQGLARFDRATGTFRAYREADGLASDYVFAIVEDAQGALWLSTNQGLSRFDPHTERFRNYAVEARQQIGDHTKRAVFRSPDGELFFGARDRIVSFFPDRVKDNPYVPPVVITALERTNDDSLSGRPVVDRTIYLKDQVTFTHKDLILTFELAALSYYQNEHNRYAYRLEGFSDQWIELGTRRRFTFTNLNPGTYTLSVRGSNNHGVWSEETQLGVQMLPPWWRAPWAYLGYVLMLGAVAVGLVRNRLNRIRLNNRIALEHVRAESLHELDQAKSRFFANISHEFRTPLTLILGPLEDLHDGLGGHIDPEAQRLVGLAISNGHRLLRLVNQLLDVSRLEHGRLQLQARHADLAAFIKALGQAFLALAERKRITLAIHVPAQPLWAYFDTEQMERVLFNLLSNAFKFTPTGGRLTVQVKEDDHHAVITVQDDGPGIAPDHLPRLFDRFYQADSSSTRRHPGAGIGLALVKSLVELHRGQIAVDSTLGAGTTFTVQLPLGRTHLTDDEVIPEDALETTWQDAPPLLTDEIDEIRLERGERTASPASPGNEDRTTVLVVDDNADMRAYVRQHLMADYRVIEAADGRAALEQARACVPDLIISDVMMPELDGYSLCRALKADPELDFIPVILLTAKASQESKIEGLERGADAYVTKPFSVREIEVRVRQLIAQRQRLKTRLQAGVRGRGGLQTDASALPASPEEIFLAQVRSVIDSCVPEEDFGVDELAEAMTMSRSTLYRRLGDLGHSPMDMIWEVRLSRAASLLQEEAGNVSEVAYAVGFKSVSHFGRRFRALYGVSPSAYAAQHAE